MKRETLHLIGRIASAARAITGGADQNGFPVPPAGVDTISGRVRKLREMLDEYDRAMIEEAG